MNIFFFLEFSIITTKVTEVMGSGCVVGCLHYGQDKEKHDWIESVVE
jgi:hypothetical protein